MKNKLLIIVCLFFPFTAHSQHIEASTTNPLWGEPVEVTYRPDSASLFQLADDVYVQYTVFHEDYSKESDLLKMEKEGQQFKIIITVGQHTAAYSFQFRNPIVYDRSAPLVLKPISSAGTFYRNAYQFDLRTI